MTDCQKKQEPERNGDIRQKGYGFFQIAIRSNVAPKGLHQGKRPKSKKHMQKKSCRRNSHCAFRRRTDAESVAVRSSVKPGKKQLLQKAEQYKENQILFPAPGCCQHCGGRSPCNPPNKIMHLTSLQIRYAGSQKAGPNDTEK